MSLLVLGVGMVLLGIMLRPMGGGALTRPPMAAIGAAYLLPALFLAWVVLTCGPEATHLRLALLGFGFRGAEGQGLEAGIGGDRERSDIWFGPLGVSGHGAVQAAKLVLAPPGGKVPQRLVLQVLPAESGAFFAIRRARSASWFEWLGGQQRLAPIEGAELVQGDLIRVGGRSWRLEVEGEPLPRLVDDQGHTVAIPSRHPKLSLVVREVELPFGRTLPLGQETYPLSYLEKAVTGALASPASRAFLYREPVWHGEPRIFLAAPGSSASVTRVGTPVPIPGATELGAGDWVHVVGLPRWDEEGFAAGGIRDLRGFRASAGEHSLAVEIETKELHSLRWEDLEALRFGGAVAADAPWLVSLSMGDWLFTDRSLHLNEVSHRIAGEALATLEMPAALGQREETFGAATPRGRSRWRLGQPVWLGGNRLAAVQLDLLSPPRLLAGFALLLAILKVAAARASLLTRAHLWFAAAVEALVSFRLLLAFRVWSTAPFSEEAYRLALVAWMVLPWGVLAAGLPAAMRPRSEGDADGMGRRLPAYGGLLLAASWCLRFGGGGLRTLCWGACLGLLVATPPLFASWQRWVGGPVERCLSGVRGAWRRAALWSLAACVPGLFRVILLAAGIKESLQIGGQRFALSLLHVPVAIVLEALYLAWLWRQATEKGHASRSEVVPGLAFVVCSWIGPAALVSDFGLALVNVPVFLVAWSALGLAAMRMQAERRSEERVEGWPGGFRNWSLTRGLPVALLVGYLGVTAVPAGTRLVAGALGRLRSEEVAERNYLRLLAFSYPEKLGGIARRSSEELAVMNAVMQQYTSRPWSQCRYFSAPVSPHLRATALREHATAVLVAPEWGLGGVIGLLLIYLAAAIAGLSLAPWRAEAEEPAARNELAALSARFTALLAALTLAVVSGYMVLANYRLVLFTGRNSYLLGLDSTADVIEALVLTTLFAAAVAAARDAERWEDGEA